MNNFQKIRLQLNLTQQEIADQLGMTQQNVSKIESDQELRPDVARKLIGLAKTKAVDLSYDDIYAPMPDEESKAA